MRIALISDIHANGISLDAVLAHIQREGVDQTVCLGDVAANGPQPRRVLQQLRAFGCPVVRGNTEEWFLVPQTYDPNSEKERRLMAMAEWALQQFTPDDIEYMRTFQPRAELPLGDGATLLCFHGSPQSNTDVILATSPNDDLARMLDGYRATVLAGGHTHQQMLREYRGMLLVNPGSVGMPIEHGATPAQDHRPPWAAYAIVEAHKGTVSVSFKRVPIDVRAVVQSARDSSMPHVEVWAGEWGIGDDDHAR